VKYQGARADNRMRANSAAVNHTCLKGQHAELTDPHIAAGVGAGRNTAEISEHVIVIDRAASVYDAVIANR